MPPTLTTEGDRLAFALASCTLSFGPHNGNGNPRACGTCARELAHWIVTGRVTDANIEGRSAMLSALPPLNDGPWRDDAHRTAVLVPYLPRLLALDPADDQRRAYAAADYAARVAGAEALRAAGRTDDADKLAALPPIVDHETAGAAAWVTAEAAARAAGGAAAWVTARATAGAAAWAAGGAAAWVTARATAGAAAWVTAEAAARVTAEAAARAAGGAAAWVTAGATAWAAAWAARSAAWAARSAALSANAAGPTTIERNARGLLDAILAA